jgi:heme exporter protein CcmB
VSRWLGHALAIAGRDLRREARARDHAAAALALALLMLLTFAFTFDVVGERVRPAAPGILWVTLIFTGTFVAGRGFAGELERGTLEGLILAPIDRGAIYLGKLLSTLLVMLGVEAVVLPIYGVLFNVAALSPAVLVVVAAGSVGFASLATLFAALAVNLRAREVLLPVLLLPFAAPLVIAGVRATDLALGGRPAGADLPWLELAVGLAVLYVAAGLAVIDHALEDMG